MAKPMDVTNVSLDGASCTSAYGVPTCAVVTTS